VEPVVAGGLAERGPRVEVEGAVLLVDDAGGAHVEQHEGAPHRRDVDRLVVPVEDPYGGGEQVQLPWGASPVASPVASIEAKGAPTPSRSPSKRVRTSSSSRLSSMRATTGGSAARSRASSAPAESRGCTTPTAIDGGSASGSAPPPTTPRTSSRDRC